MERDLRLIPKFRERLSYIYVEHAVLEREDHAVAIWDEGEGKTQIPVASLALLMLGPGTKISHAAISVLAENRCLAAWVGEEGVRMYSAGKSANHSSGLLLEQAKRATDERLRTAMARTLFAKRFGEFASSEHSLEQLRGMEGIRVRSEYSRLAAEFAIAWTGREVAAGDWDTTDNANRALSAANACLYGVCHAAISALGLSPGLGFIHTGNQLSFVYDVADLYKLELAVPIAFREAAGGAFELERRVRLSMRDRFRETRFVARVAADLLSLFEPEVWTAFPEEGKRPPPAHSDRDS
ncbi:MAG: type I-E CRISPR-associated endonuclease Cas1 [Armatimonadetes bacterium]|nr:type I-E CRISPR-associated endonuclease Cas1 [Armatimonadota bacterium]NOG92331.1 type I-E CRISPR-associated endonuclease Cas1 [Armatimonadota bacterium]